MLTKILFTTAVIFVALIFIRHKNSQSRQQTLAQQAQQAQQAAEQRRTAMFVAMALVALTLAISTAVYYWHWQEEHRLFSVQVINSHSGVEQTYDVYQSDIDGRSFRTIEGRLINLADTERMEVQEKTDK